VPPGDANIAADVLGPEQARADLPRHAHRRGQSGVCPDQSRASEQGRQAGECHRGEANPSTHDWNGRRND
jgi:hypothetical protein